MSKQTSEAEEFVRKIVRDANTNEEIIDKIMDYFDHQYKGSLKRRQDQWGTDWQSGRKNL